MNDLEKTAVNALTEYIAKQKDEIIKNNIEAVIGKEPPSNFKELNTLLLQEKITFLTVTQECSSKLPKKIYVIFKDEVPVKFFEVKTIMPHECIAYPTLPLTYGSL